jgi:hypothetical protein
LCIVERLSRDSHYVVVQQNARDHRRIQRCWCSSSRHCVLQKLVRVISPNTKKHVLWYVHERVWRRDNAGSRVIEFAFNVRHKPFIGLPSNVRDIASVVGHPTEISVDVHVRLCYTIVVVVVHPTNILFTEFVRNRIEQPYHLSARQFHRMVSIGGKRGHLKEGPISIDAFRVGCDGLSKSRDSQLDILVMDYRCVSNTFSEFFKLCNIKRPSGCCELELENRLSSVVQRLRTDA